jgi:ribosomal protein S18 acetylase RimI-like enzyme
LDQIDRALAELRQRGHAECTLWVLEENRPARRFYEKLGWQFDGGRKQYANTKVPEVRYRMAIRY